MLKIISQTKSEITISAPKTAFSSKIIGFLSFLLCSGTFSSIFIVAFTTEYSKIGILKVSCDRIELTQVDCQVSKSQYFDLFQQKPFAYKFVKSAKYNTIKSTDSEGDVVCQHNFLLITKSGEKAPFKSLKSSTAITVTISLSSFVESKQKSFDYTLDECKSVNFIYEIFLFLPLIMFLVIGFISLYISFSILINPEELLLDKYKKELKHINRTLLGDKVSYYLFNEVVKVDVLYAADSYNNVSFIPRITIKKELQFNLNAVKDRQVAINITNNLNEFIGLSEEEYPIVKQQIRLSL